VITNLWGGDLGALNANDAELAAIRELLLVGGDVGAASHEGLVEFTEVSLVTELNLGDAVEVDGAGVANEYHGRGNIGTALLGLVALEVVAGVADGGNLLEDVHEKGDVGVLVVSLELLNGGSGLAGDEHHDCVTHIEGCGGLFVGRRLFGNC
jgi:hypothetical protein